MLALIDADIVAYRCASSCEPTKTKLFREPLEVAILRTEELMRRIVADTKSEEYVAFLSGSENFRYNIFPAYKANRKDKEKPYWLNDCLVYLIQEWKAETTHGYEADDAIGINHVEGESIVCSIDKDLLQLEGDHYNFVRQEFIKQSLSGGERTLYYQLLVGDAADNVAGVRGIGPVNARRILDSAGDIESLHASVRELYNDDKRFNMNYALLKILRSEEEYEGRLKEINENSKRKSEGPEAPTSSSESTN